MRLDRSEAFHCPLIKSASAVNRVDRYNGCEPGPSPSAFAAAPLQTSSRLSIGTANLISNRIAFHDRLPPNVKAPMKLGPLSAPLRMRMHSASHLALLCSSLVCHFGALIRRPPEKKGPPNELSIFHLQSSGLHSLWTLARQIIFLCRRNIDGLSSIQVRGSDCKPFCPFHHPMVECCAF